MGFVSADDCMVARRDDGNVVLRIPAGGRDRMIVLGAEDAIRVGTALVNVGADLLDDFDRIPKVSNVLLMPFDKSGNAMLRIATEGSGGEILLSINAHWLLALAQSAEAALEFSKDGGLA
ncbi:hypothetical protein SPHV1_2180037 [Novosphingobium sp. KN65.2]|nr:hypothetical protein SPHV1_2180037 [Novosphingobium sp. KN65.2]